MILLRIKQLSFELSHNIQISFHFAPMDRRLSAEWDAPSPCQNSYETLLTFIFCIGFTSELTALDGAFCSREVSGDTENVTFTDRLSRVQALSDFRPSDENDQKIV